MQTETELTLSPEEKFELWRYPKQATHSTLRAWDASDLYLVNELKSENKKELNMLIINDSFGAISCMLADIHHLSWYNDSKVAALALDKNLACNQIDLNKVQRLTTLTSDKLITKNYHKIIIKLPKSIAYLEFILTLIHQAGLPNCDVLLAGKASDFSPNIIKKLKSLYDDVIPSRIVKKSRYISLSGQKSQTLQFNYWQPNKEKFNDLITDSAPNVFSRGKLDIGGRFLADNLPSIAVHAHILDLGCGNGLLGLAILKQCPTVNVDFYDESAMAIESAQHNCLLNEFNLDQTRFIQDDCAKTAQDTHYDLIVCNPPFHQLNAITDHIAEQMFTDAYRILKPGGELRIVGNRHLAYQQKLMAIFGQCDPITSNQKFVILSAIKN